MGMYPGLNCPNGPSSDELSMAEIDTRIHKVLYLEVILNPRASLTPFQRGVTSLRVSTLGTISAAFAILSFHCAHDSAHGLRGDHRHRQVGGETCL
jgi:hypothetical protein